MAQKTFVVRYEYLLLCKRVKSVDEYTDEQLRAVAEIAKQKADTGMVRDINTVLHTRRVYRNDGAKAGDKQIMVENRSVDGRHTFKVSGNANLAGFTLKGKDATHPIREEDIDTLIAELQALKPMLKLRAVDGLEFDFNTEPKAEAAGPGVAKPPKPKRTNQPATPESAGDASVNNGASAPAETANA